MNEEQQELTQQQQQSMIDQNKDNKMKEFNTSDSITFNLKETEIDPEFYKEIQERADEAKKRLAEQGLEIVEEDNIVDFATNPNIETTTFVISMNKETGKFHYYEDDNNE